MPIKANKLNGVGSVTDDIEKLLRRMKPRHFIVPQVPPRVDDQVVCPADSRMKRLFTLAARTRSELEELVREGDDLGMAFKFEGNDRLTISRFVRRSAENPNLAAVYAERAAAFEGNSRKFGEMSTFFAAVEALCEAELSRRAPRTFEGGYVTIDSNWNIVRTKVDPRGKKREDRKILGVLYAV